ncbi:MAG: histone deacetylase [Chloroflexi bacterium]|nr:histone deacetylase [Chloroflexota bacterium]
MMTRTGIFFTYFQGERLRDFPQALAGLLDKENVTYYDAVYESRDGLNYLAPLSEELLLRVHSRRMVEAVKLTGDYESALYSAGGTVQAAEAIRQGKIDNAFVFTSFGDHHAGRDFYGGMCYFNGAALAITSLKDKGVKRFAIVDTDAHHADGTRDIFARDESVLHVCFCYQDYSDCLNKVDVLIPGRTSDEDYLAKVRREFAPRALAFQPEYIFWEFGYDATRGEYGDKGLTRDCHIKLAKLFKEVADRVCQGRLIVILCGGSGRATATYTIPRIIACLAGLDR